VIGGGLIVIFDVELSDPLLLALFVQGLLKIVDTPGLTVALWGYECYRN
jgi:hypothetical protein